MWKQIDGYRWPYRINEDGRIQKFWQGQWVELHPYLSGGRTRAMVKMRSADNRKIEVPMVWLMADAFMGGRRDGYAIIHKDGAKLNNAVFNLEFMPRKHVGNLSKYAKRKTVLKINPAGEVVDIFRSAREAADHDYISRNAVCDRCRNKVRNPFLLNGYTYQYEK